ncbi:hypothetical protein [Planktothrix phage Pra-JY27]|nr:hypothetical protein [Planktothrix phage Pag-Yong1]WEV89200.1 hypothetical protein [Synechococcus phage MinM2]
MPQSEANKDGISILSAQAVTTSGTSAQSAAFGTQTRMVRLCATQAVYFRVGQNPTAINTDTLLPANTVERVAVKPGWRVAALQVSAGGSLSIAECE